MYINDMNINITLYEAGNVQSPVNQSIKHKSTQTFNKIFYIRHSIDQ